MPNKRRHLDWKSLFNIIDRNGRLWLLALLMIAVLGFGLTAGRRAQGDSDTLLTVLQRDGRFGNLTAAIERSGLTPLVRDHGPFTLFAPTNAALAAYDLSRLSETQLRQLLLHHIVQGAYERPLLAAQGSLRTTLGETLRVGGGDVPVLDGRVRLSGDPLRASNGVIYVIDTLLLPPTSYMQLTPASAAPPVNQPPANQPPVNQPPANQPPPSPVTPPPAASPAPNTVEPAVVPFNEAAFRRSVLDVHDALRLMGGALDGYRADPAQGCPAYQAQFFRLANAPFYIEVPPRFQADIERYEAAINHVLQTNEPYVLYCMQGAHAFSDFNFGLARSGIGEAAALLEPLFKYASGQRVE